MIEVEDKEIARAEAALKEIEQEEGLPKAA